MPHDCYTTECDVRLTGYDEDNVVSDRELSYIFFNRGLCSLVVIKSSSFQGGYDPFFTLDRAYLRLSKTVFHIQSHRTRPEHLIDFDLSSQSFYTSVYTAHLTDVLINLTSVDRYVQQVSIMSIVADTISIQTTQILCPLGMNVVETPPISRSKQSVYHCEAACTSGMYTFQSGNMTLDGRFGFMIILRLP